MAVGQERRYLHIIFAACNPLLHALVRDENSVQLIDSGITGYLVLIEVLFRYIVPSPFPPLPYALAESHQALEDALVS